MPSYDDLFGGEAIEYRRSEPHPALQDERIRKSSKFSHRPRKPLPDSVERESYKPVLRVDATAEFERFGGMRELVAVAQDGTLQRIAVSRNPELLTQFWASLREYLAMHKRVVAMGGPPPQSLMPRGDDRVAASAGIVLGMGEDVEVSIR